MAYQIRGGGFEFRGIEKCLELPPVAKPGGRAEQYTFDAMEIGESAFFVGEVSRMGKCPPYNAAQCYGRNTGKKFSGRRVEGGIRIWRVK